ncbi:MAG TPA: N-acylglucosamine 2-epimerase [Armatimonadetes bacterium]|nr:N-acylglucosamine 2-epimerase [Armatimonadota bacterium]
MANRLAGASSPYLRQHADNPVDWYPWGNAAFAAAAERDVPVFLSVGYATCHWCHRFAAESFENESVAAELNQAFVCIKVDREERPDLDDYYMTAVMLLNGSGGWPLTAILLPDRRPFFGGTYYTVPQLLQIIDGLSQLWRDSRDKVVNAAEQLAAAIAAQHDPAPVSGNAGPAEVRTAVAELLASQDLVYGGQSGAPRFPQDMTDRLLLQHWQTAGDANALQAALASLVGMAAGGIHDHLAGGLHRYSVDGSWSVPHFEKMLYNQAGLLQAYADAAAVTGSGALRHVAQGIVDFVAAELTDPATGAYWSALDADSEGQEGTYYWWRPSRAADVLGPELTAQTPLVIADSRREVAVDSGLGLDGVVRLPAQGGLADLAADLASSAYAESVVRLGAARAERVRPATDDKVLTGWNGLFIAALAAAGDRLDEPSWLELATRTAGAAAGWHTADGVLVRVAGSDQPGQLEDYAGLGLGYYELWRATGEARWLAAAVALAQQIEPRFGAPSGPLHAASAELDDLPVRPRDVVDNALPSGNSLAAELLLSLAVVVEPQFPQGPAVQAALAALAQRLLGELGPRAVRAPRAHPASLRLVLERLYPLASAPVVRSSLLPATAGRDARVRLSTPPGWHLGNAPGELPFVRHRDNGAARMLPLLDHDQAAGWAEFAWPEECANTDRPTRITVQVCDRRRCLAPTDVWLAPRWT